MRIQKTILIIGAVLIFLRLVFPVVRVHNLYTKTDQCVQSFYPIIGISGRYEVTTFHGGDCADIVIDDYSSDWTRTLVQAAALGLLAGAILLTSRKTST